MEKVRDYVVGELSTQTKVGGMWRGGRSSKGGSRSSRPLLWRGEVRSKICLLLSKFVPDLPKTFRLFPLPMIFLFIFIYLFSFCVPVFCVSVLISLNKLLVTHQNEIHVSANLLSYDFFTLCFDYHLLYASFLTGYHRRPLSTSD